MTVTWELELSLTNVLVPPVVHCKQYDNLSRKVVCRVFKGYEEVFLDDDSIVNVSGKRPDGEIFQYCSDGDSGVVYVENGHAVIWITDTMTSVPGRMPVDVTITDGNGEILGIFPFILAVKKSAVDNKGLTTGSYSDFLAEFLDGIIDCYIDSDGYLVIVTSDSLGLSFMMDGDGNITIYTGGDSS
ncbi:MAG: hypothetical protein LUH03_10935 [Oscillospiraceae bacterium]|nr:hypothetical protein [Oscillospiraceae bacterium]